MDFKLLFALLGIIAASLIAIVLSRRIRNEPIRYLIMGFGIIFLGAGIAGLTLTIIGSRIGS